MIPTLIVMLMRRYQKSNPQQFLAIRARFIQVLRVALIIVIALVMTLITGAQEKTLSYAVSKNGKKIGDMYVKEIKEGGTIYLRLQSDIRTSFILKISAKGIEEARYDSGILTYSSVYQDVNGSEKINQQITYVNKTYIINNKGREEKLDNVKIYYNLLCIYNHEPRGAASLIFSDKYQKFLRIEKIEEHHYRIAFPDGSTNEYWFEDGVCHKIKCAHQFYTAMMELKK
ncbi:MAG: DUF6134 family protein [Flavisolibacter sp.]